MRLFEQYRRRYLLQFLMDVCIIGMLALSAAFTALNHQKWDDKYWFWLVITLVAYGVIRCVMLLVWLIKAIAHRHFRLLIIVAFHVVFLGALTRAAMYLVMLGILGITPDGTEGRH